MLPTASPSPREAQKAIKYHLPELVHRYLQDVEKDRAWINSTNLLQHFDLGKRESLVVLGLLKMKATTPKQILDPGAITSIPVFVLQVRERWNSYTRTNYREFLVEANPFYSPN